MVPVYDKIVPALLDGGVWNLAETCSFSLGIPCEPMLSASAKSVSEIINRYRDIEYTCEYKYDGIRAQVILHIPCWLPFFTFTVLLSLFLCLSLWYFLILCYLNYLAFVL